MKENLELRMYFFTIYQLTGIQKGIQCGHAALEYANKYSDSSQYKDFINKWKTWIILNGGISQNNLMPEEGSINYVSEQLFNAGIDRAVFREPDLNNAMTAICFIADERVFNRKDYPDFIDWLSQFDVLDPDYDAEEFYGKWVAFVGGKKNVKLREIIADKRLA